MAFWNLSDGESVDDKKEYEAPSGGGNYLFSDGTTVAMVIEEMNWTSFNGGEEFINARLSVVSPETDADGVKIANRKIFAKLYVEGGNKERNKDPEKAKKKADRDKRMLGAMASNAGGGLLKLEGRPTNEDFSQHMLMKPMLVRLGLWEMEINGESRSGNYIQAVSPYEGKVDAVEGADKPAQKAASTMSQGSALDSDEIPFSPCM